MTARSLPRPARGSWVSPRWAAAFAEGAALLTVLCGLIIAAALLSRPA
ncbi:MAG TPA: hypothetical protein VFJ71_11060 [Candidatus Limnocylindrales bacterium]|nr:hypothetical protein [Candidatus Limnocylindrales bacterium]